MGVPEDSYELGDDSRILSFRREEVDSYDGSHWQCEIQVSVDSAYHAVEAELIDWHSSIHGSNVCLRLLGER